MIRVIQASKPTQCNIFSTIVKKFPLQRERDEKRGSDQIRTGVEAFAELCLATRPQNLKKLQFRTAYLKQDLIPTYQLKMVQILTNFLANK